MYREIWGKLRVPLIAMLLMLAAGTAGYVLIEGWPAFDALYMTVITLGTIGYGETHELHTAGRVFTMLLIFSGLGIAAYSFSVMTAFIVEGDLSDVLRRRKMESRIAKLHGHYIVCGAGFTGKAVLEELHKTQRPFVVIERDEARARELEEKGLLAIRDDASRELVLEQAGVARAKGLFCCLGSDRDNVFIALTARTLSQTVRIVSELHDESARNMLVRGGADSVVSSEHIGGLRMASEMIRPAAVGFLDSMIRDRGSAYRFEEIPLRAGSPLVGRELGSIKPRPGESPVVLAVKDSGGGYAINPSADRRLAQDDVLVVLGSTDEVGKLRASA